jgi:hypothetical protein
VAAIDGDDSKQSALDGSGRYADSGLEPIEDFAGREWLFSAIQQWRAGTERMLAVIGPPGVGKTSLFAELAYQQAVAGDRWLAAVWTCSDYRTNADVEAALAATITLTPHDALLWQLLIAVYLLESGQADRARQLARDALRGNQLMLPDDVVDLAAWCLARLAPLLEHGDIARMADMLLDGHERHVLVLQLIRAGQFERAVGVLGRMSGGFEHDRAARGLIYHALATQPVKDVRTIAHLMLDRLPRSSYRELFRSFSGRVSRRGGGYDELAGPTPYAEYEECFRVCQAVLGVRGVTEIAFNESGDIERPAPNRSARAHLLAVLSMTGMCWVP